VVELLAVVDELDPVVDAEVVPGIVAALTAPNRPTPATAARAAAVVIRFSSRSARSRARMRLSVVSMPPAWVRALNRACGPAERSL